MAVFDESHRMQEAARVEALAGFGPSEADMARVFDVEVDTLNSTSAKEMASGQIMANASRGEPLSQSARGRP